MPDNLSLLFHLRAENSQAKAALAETRAAVTQLRTSFGSDLSAMESVSKTALAGIGQHLNEFVGVRLPLVGGAFIRVQENLRGLGTESKKGEQELAHLNQTIANLSSATGKSTSEITTFLQGFVHIESQAQANAAAVAFLGATTAEKLTPELVNAGAELQAVAVSSEAAGTSIASTLGTVGIGILAIAALSAGLGLLVKELFDLTKSSAEWKGALFNTSQQLGISTETLSAFEVLAKATGSDLGSVTAALGIFQKHLEAAQDPTSKEAKLLEGLGIEATNTEDALRQTLTQLAAMPAGFHQTAVALELFGRGGKSILAILKEMHGDLDGAIDRFREMGLIVSEEDAKAAHELNDEFDLLQLQIRAVTAQITKDAIPIILQAVKDISKALKDNKDVIHDVTGAVTFLFNVLNEARKIQLGFINEVLSVVNPALTTLAELYERIARAAHQIIPVDFSQAQAALGGHHFLESEVGHGAAGLLATAQHQPKRAEEKTGLTEAQKDAKAELEILQTKAQDAQRIYQYETEGLRIQFDQRKQSLRDYTQAVIEEAGKELKARQDVTTEERKEADILPERKKQVELARIKLKEEQDQDDYTLRVAHAQEAQRKAEEQAEDQHQQNLLSLRQTYDEANIARIKDLADKEYISRLDAQKQIEVIEKAAFEREQNELLRRLQLVKGNQEEEDKITDELNKHSADRARQEQENVRLTTEAVQQGSEAYREYRNALFDVALEIAQVNRAIVANELARASQFIAGAARIQIIQREAQLEKDAIQDVYDKRKTLIDKAEYDERQKHIGDEQKLLEIERYYHALRLAEEQKFQSDQAEIDRQTALAKRRASPLGQFDLGSDQLREFAKTVQDSVVPLNQILTNSFFQVADAIGSVVEQWVLYGETGPAVMRKILATALATIAKEATINAIKELAVGFALLAVGDPGAGAAFTSAALWGAIGGISALAGREIAGGAFKQKSGGSSAGSLGGSTPQALQTITTGRNQPSQTIIIQLKGDDSKLGSFITAHVVGNFNDGGEIREVIANDGR